MFANVIDSNGFKVVFTLLNDDGTTKFYELKDGEEIIEKDWDIANTMNKPKWNGSSWVDKEPLPIEPAIPLPTLEERTKANEDMLMILLDMQMGGI